MNNIDIINSALMKYSRERHQLHGVEGRYLFPVVSESGALTAKYIAYIRRPSMVTYGVEFDPMEFEVAESPGAMLRAIEHKLDEGAKKLQEVYSKYCDNPPGKENPNGCPMCGRE